MAKGDKVRSHVVKEKPKRPGIHSKKRTSLNKSSKNYVKPYKGQGR